jgi:hypothetical protein
LWVPIAHLQTNQRDRNGPFYYWPWKELNVDSNYNYQFD